MLAALCLGALATGATTASAVVVRLANGTTVSYQQAPNARAPFARRMRARAGAGARVFDASTFKNLEYNGGPVMPSNTNYAVYWDPKGGPAYPGDYKSGLNRFFEDLAHDSGGH